ncbi:MAG: hypothetical protein H6831_15665 [Planctomycetes bacterium]|nr:hypothetical protein [Planctomycetota bacterium]MCB9905836.1 hypothetical protein [Planctomycetota bacterium]
MKDILMRRHGRRLLFCSLCAFLLVWSATAQVPEVGPDPVDEGQPVEEEAPAPFSPREDAGDLEAEMRKIFQRVETKLRDIDVLLTDASAGDTRRLAEAGEAGIDELLRRSVEDGRAVQREIDELLQLAQQVGSSCSSSSSSSSQNGQGQQGQSSGQPSPLDQGPGSQRSQEATPTLPEQSQPGGEPEGEQHGDQPGGEQEGEQPADGKQQPGEGEQPEDGPERPDDDPRNIAGDDPKAGETSAPSRADLSERWGELPVHVRDVFRTEGGEDMPAEYRDWIDAYYRKLNERAAQGR